MGKGKKNLGRVTPVFEKDKVSISRFGEGATHGVYGEFYTDFFMEYEADGEPVTLTHSLLEATRAYFKGEKKISVFTEDNEIIISGENEEYREELTEEVGEPIDFDMKDTEFGFVVPAKKVTRALVYADVLKVKADVLTLKFEDERLKIIKEQEVSKYTKKIKPNRFEGKPVEIKILGDLFYRIIQLLEGEVWVNIYKGALILSMKKDEYKVSYILGARG